MSVLKITKENYETEVLKSDKLVLIDFYADWCGPCKMMSPIIDEIAEEVGDTVSHPAVIATRPARDPFRDMDTSGFL